MGTDAARGVRELNSICTFFSSARLIIETDVNAKVWVHSSLWISCGRGSHWVYHVNFLRTWGWEQRGGISSWFSRGDCSSTPSFGGGFCRHELALAGTLSVLFTRFRGASGRKWVYPALRWANNKERNTKAICRSPSTNKGGVRLFVCNSTCGYRGYVWCVVLKPCPCASLPAFQSLPLCFSPRYLTCPLPSSPTSPVPDPLISVPLCAVLVLPHVFPCRAALFCVSCAADRRSVSSCLALVCLLSNWL